LALRGSRAWSILGEMEANCMDENEQLRESELIEEIQRRIRNLLSSDEFTVEEKEAIARKFFQALEGE
jgi:hypothetical protein